LSPSSPSHRRVGPGVLARRQLVDIEDGVQRPDGEDGCNVADAVAGRQRAVRRAWALEERPTDVQVLHLVGELGGEEEADAALDRREIGRVAGPSPEVGPEEDRDGDDGGAEAERVMSTIG